MEQRNGRVAGILEGNEEVEDRVDLGRDELVVTSRRVLALRSSDDGASYRAVERSSVTDVTAEADGDRALLKKAGLIAGFGAVPLALDATLDFDELLSISRSDVPASAQQLVDWILLTFTAIDLSLTILWSLSAIAALAYLAAYYRGRGSVLRLGVVGAADVEIPADEEPPVERIDAAIAPETSADRSDPGLASEPSAGALASEPAIDQSDDADDSAAAEPADPFPADQSGETVDDVFASAADPSDDRNSPGMTNEEVEELFDSDSADDASGDPFTSERSDGEAEDPFEQS